MSKMELCSKCGGEAELDWLGRCEPCFRRNLFNVKDNLYPTTKRMYRDGEGAISPAHENDIRRRMVSPDGDVFRDVGRKSFIVP